MRQIKVTSGKGCDLDVRPVRPGQQRNERLGGAAHVGAGRLRRALGAAGPLEHLPPDEGSGADDVDAPRVPAYDVEMGRLRDDAAMDAQTHDERAVAAGTDDHAGLVGVHRDERGERVDTVKGERRRRLHKAFLRYHDPNNWPLLREALKKMGRGELIGNGRQHLIPAWQPVTDGSYQSARRANSSSASKPATTPELQKKKQRAGSAPRRGAVWTQHTGLPPRTTR